MSRKTGQDKNKTIVRVLCIVLAVAMLIPIVISMFLR